MRSVLYSAYASSIVLSHHGIEPLLTPASSCPTLRLALRTVDPHRETLEAAERLRAEAERIYRESREMIVRAMTVSMVRRIYYAGLRSPGYNAAAASPSADRRHNTRDGRHRQEPPTGRRRKGDAYIRLP